MNDSARWFVGQAEDFFFAVNGDSHVTLQIPHSQIVNNFHSLKLGKMSRQNKNLVSILASKASDIRYYSFKSSNLNLLRISLNIDIEGTKIVHNSL